jgi:hypothetical protein
MTVQAIAPGNRQVYAFSKKCKASKACEVYVPGPRDIFSRKLVRLVMGIGVGLMPGLK